MGADMLLAGLPAAELTEDRKRRLQEIIRGLTGEELVSEELPDVADDPAGVREVLGHHVERLAGATRSRDVARLQLPHMPYAMFFTGGPSWGDDPTGMFETFAVLADIELVFAQLEIWAKDESASHPARAGERSGRATFDLRRSCQAARAG